MPLGISKKGRADISFYCMVILLLDKNIKPYKNTETQLLTSTTLVEKYTFMPHH
jgi:hypothetical protein